MIFDIKNTNIEENNPEFKFQTFQHNSSRTFNLPNFNLLNVCQHWLLRNCYSYKNRSFYKYVILPINSCLSLSWDGYDLFLGWLFLHGLLLLLSITWTKGRPPYSQLIHSTMIHSMHSQLIQPNQPNPSSRSMRRCKRLTLRWCMLAGNDDRLNWIDESTEMNENKKWMEWNWSDVSRRRKSKTNIHVISTYSNTHTYIYIYI